MKKKYEFTGDTLEHNVDFIGAILRRIRALIDIKRHGVKKGDLGGRVEHASNLSHDLEAQILKVVYLYRQSRLYDRRHGTCR